MNEFFLIAALGVFVVAAAALSVWLKSIIFPSAFAQAQRDVRQLIAKANQSAKRRVPR